MIQQRYFDKSNNRLIYIKQRASAKFWDKHWQKYDLKSNKISKKEIQQSSVVKTTRKFLKSGKILEGGCGTGKNVLSLHLAGYSVYGVDFAKKTVKKINKNLPKLNVTAGDVRKLKFKNDFFDACWSLGVIEHFHKGYKPILKEMGRVVKSGGYVFLTFPYMSPVRKLKTRFGLYKKFNQKIKIRKFYQFVLDPKKVKKDFEKYGFKLRYCKTYDGIKGFKDEILIVKPILQKLYDYRGKNIWIYRLKILLNIILERFASHMILMVFKKAHE